jgi:hypothetical protein
VIARPAPGAQSDLPARRGEMSHVYLWYALVHVVPMILTGPICADITITNAETRQGGGSVRGVVVLLAAVLLGSGAGCVAAGSEVSAAVNSTSEAVVGPLYDDSGCIDVLCQGGCEQDFIGWLCWMEGTFERYDENMNGLPIRVKAHADCTVVGLSIKSGSCTATSTGSGRVTAHASCWITAWWISLFESDGWLNESRSWCRCEEL